MAIPRLNDKGRMADVPLSPGAKITVERRGEIVLIGVSRPQSYNRFDPDAFFGLAKALDAGIGLAQKVAACGPLGIKATLGPALLSIDESQAAAFTKLDEQFGGLFRTADFIEGRKAEAAGRPPVYQGN